MANKITIADVAAATGVTKPTVKKKAIDLGIYEKMSVIDARGRRVMTAEQASMLTHVIMQTHEQIDLLSKQQEAQESAQMELIGSLREQIVTLKDMLDEQKMTIQALQRSLDAMNSNLENRQIEIDKLHAELARAHSGFAELAAAHWWQKRAVVAQYALLPPNNASEN